MNAANASAAKRFGAGSKSTFEVLQVAAGDGVAYWAGIQRSIVQMQGQKEATPMDLRVTEVFHREEGGWKLVHRHADPLKEDSRGAGRERSSA